MADLTWTPGPDLNWTEDAAKTKPTESALTKAGKILADPEGGVGAAAGSLIMGALPQGGKDQGWLGDTMLDIARAPISSSQTIAGLGNLATGGLVGKALDAIGYDPKTAQAELSARYSDSRKQQQQNVADVSKTAEEQLKAAEGPLDTTKAALSGAGRIAGSLILNPGVVQDQIVQTLPDMLTGAGIVGSAAKRIAAKGGAEALGAAAGKLSWLGHGIEGAQAAGQNAEQLREEDPDNLAGQYLQVPAGALTALIGRGASKVPGFGDVQTAAQLAIAGPKGAGSLLAGRGGVTQRLLKAGISEGLLQELPQSAQEKIWQNLAQGKPWNEDILTEGVQGAVAGAVMGVGGGAISGSPARKSGTSQPAPGAPTDADIAGANADNAELRGAFDAYGGVGATPLLEEKPIVVQNPTTGNITELDRRAGPLEAAAAQAVESGLTSIAQNVNAGEVLQPFQNLQAAQGYVQMQADPELFDVIPHPRVAGTHAVVPKTGTDRQAILDKRAAAGANQAAEVRAAQLKQDESPNEAGVTEKIKGRFGDGGEGTVTVTPRNDGGFEISVSSQVGPAKRTSRAGFAPGVTQAEAIKQATAAHGGFTSEKVAPAKPKPTIDTSTEDAAQDELAPKPVQKVTDMPGVQQQAKAQAEEAVSKAQVRAEQLAAEENPETVDAGAQAANPAPTDAQKSAGNYAKGHITVGGLDISVETPAGATRTGRDGAKTWKVKNTAHYGYVKRTNGADGEQVDVYVKPGTAATHDGQVFVVDQYNPATGAFDEHKVMLGYGNAAEAAKAYDAHFSDKSGSKRRGAVTAMTVGGFKAWLKNGNTKSPVSSKKFDGQASDTAQEAQDEIARSTGKMSLPRSAQMPGESNADFERRRAAATQAAKDARQAPPAKTLPTKEGDKAAVREALGMAADAEVSILTPESRPDAGKAKGVSKQAAQFIEQVVRLFGKRVVFFDVADREAAEGFYVKGNTIYLNVNSSTQHLRVLGHELTHAMKRQARDAYEKMLAAVETLRTDEEMAAQYKDYFQVDLEDLAMLDQPHPGTQGTLREFLAEEWMADLGGNRFAEEGFWVSVFAQLETQHGATAAKGIIARLRAALVTALNRIKSMIGGNAFAVDARLVESLEDIRKAVAAGFAEYARLSKAGQLQEALGTETKFAKAWHGTPHAWAPEPGFPHGRPRLDKMGTGEGVQAFGWGWYSAGAQQVAEGYRAAPGAAFNVEGKTYGQLQNVWDTLSKPYRRAVTAIADSAGNTEEALFNLEAQISPESKQAAALLKMWIASGKVKQNKGSIYQLDIPDDVLPNLLDWDKPLNEQTPEVRKALGVTSGYSFLNSPKGRLTIHGGSMTGLDLYQELESFFADSKKKASEYLANLGIVGTRYLDGNSRSAGAGTYNYVIWDQPTLDRVALLERNGEKLDAIRAALSLPRTKPIAQTYNEENKTGVIVGARPGEFDWTFFSGKTPPPVQHPVQAGPRVDRLGPAVHKILRSVGAKRLFEDAFQIRNLDVHPTLGSYKGKPEPSFVMYGEGLDFEAADGLSRMLGFAFAQESTIVTQPVFSGDEDTWPALYVGSGKKLTLAQIEAVRKSAAEVGLDYTTSVDGRAFKFFMDDGEYDAFYGKVVEVAGAAGLREIGEFGTRSQFNAAETYLQSGDRPVERQIWGQTAGAGPSGLFGRTVDHLLVPYAKAVAAEGYRFSPDLFADRFGLSTAQREYIRAALRPKSGIKLSTADIVAGKEVFEPAKTYFRAKTPRSSNTDILFALQNRAAQNGQIEPGDYSDEAKAIIAEAIADEVLYHISRPEGKSAIGWYDAALKRAMLIYAKVFPELATDADKGLAFDASLGITSQGNDVYTNSLFAGRVYHLVSREGYSLSKVVRALYGTFGGVTRAIENNLLKLEQLLDRNGYDQMRKLFNEKGTVGEWNARLREDRSLYFDGKPLKIGGAARQTVRGWMVFGPKIGSFINNLHGDYSTLTADLWFSRTWNRILGFSFLHTPAKEAPSYLSFKAALIAEHTKTTEPKYTTPAGKQIFWQHGGDINYSDAELDALLADPDQMLALAGKLEHLFREGFTFSHKAADKTSGYSIRSDLRRAAKNWIELREDSVQVPRGPNERAFQQETIEVAQKIINRRSKEKITVADIQAALWYHEKELFRMFGAGDKRADPADYADAANKFMETYNNGDLFYVEKPTPRYILGGKGSYLNGGKLSTHRGGHVGPESGREDPGPSGRGLGEAFRLGSPSQALSVAGVHFSKAIRAHLSGVWFGKGTGAKSQEAERIREAADVRLKSRIYAYVNEGKGVFPEEDVGRYAHAVRFGNLYDAKADPLDLQVKAVGATRDERTNNFESSILDSGFDGYYSKNAFGNQGVAILMGEAATRGITPEYKDTEYRGKELEVPPAGEPSDFGKKLRAVSSNRSLPSGEMTGAEWKRLMPAVMPEIDVTHLDDAKRYYRDEIVKRPEMAKLSTARYEITRDEDDEGTFVMAYDVARKDDLGNPLGIGSLHVPDDAVGPKGWRIGDIWVAEDSRRQGIARELIKRMSTELGTPVTGATSVFSPDGKALFDAVKLDRTDKTSLSAKRLAPNGERSNLNERQWHQVRTPQFKAWFGDWEAAHNGKDGNGVWAHEDVSKVVDENGEPRVVYHGTQRGGFKAFDPYQADKHRSPMIFAAGTRNTSRTYSGSGAEIELQPVPTTLEGFEAQGYLFNEEDGNYKVWSPEGYMLAEDASREDAVNAARADVFEVESSSEDRESGIYSLFLNIRNPNESDFEGANWDGSPGYDQYEVWNTEDDEQVYAEDGRGVLSEDEANALAKSLGEDTHEVREASDRFETTNSVAEEAKRYGQDGAIIRNTMDSGGRGGSADIDDVFVFFDPNQAKSATQNTGTFSRINDDLRYSPPRFFSHLSRSVEQAPVKMQTQPAQQWKLWLVNQPTIKKDELTWSGVLDWLDLQGKAKVDRQQIQAYLQDNGVTLGETVLGKNKVDLEPELTEDDITVTSDDQFRWRLTSPSGRFVLVGKGTIGEEEGKAYGVRYFNSQIKERNREKLKNSNTSKFSKWVLPGGEDYRELLITLAPKPISFDDWLVQTGKDPKAVSELPDYVREVLRTKYHEAVKKMQDPNRKPGEGDFVNANHFDQPNILAHIRFDSRTDADGNPVLFLEELQSDWGQKGREKGFADTAPVDMVGWKVITLKSDEWLGQRDVAITRDDGNTVMSRYGAPLTKSDAELIADAAESLKSSRNTGKIPLGPFVQDTKAWTTLALKRAVMWAVQNGYSKVAWTTGEQQADRYDLRQQVNLVVLDKTFGGYVLRAFKDADGFEEVVTESTKDLDGVREIIGKDATNKLLRDMGNGAHGELRGADLKLGGDGMRAFYDRIVPQIANDLLRKAGGGRVEQVEVAKSGRVGKSIRPQDREGAKTRGALTLQQGFTITPEMAEKVAGEGLPLFSLRRALNGEHNTDDHLVPETPLYLNNPNLVDLAYVNGKPIRLNVGEDNGAGHGRGALHIIANAGRNQSRTLEQVTDDEGENVVRSVISALSRGSAMLHTQGAGRHALRLPMAGKTVILGDRGDHYTVVTVLPSAENKWGNSDWTGRLTFPVPADATSADPAHFTGSNSSLAGTPGQGYSSKKFDTKPPAPAAQAPIVVRVAQKRHRTLDLAAMAADGLAVKKSLPRTLNVGGVERPTTNSNGKPIAQDEAGVRRFWEWFGDSEAVMLVNANTGKPVESSKEPRKGVPLVMYHTTRNDFNIFEVGRSTVNSGTFGDWETERHAIFVTPELDASTEYGKRGGRFAKGANILPLYVKTERSLDLTQGVSSEVFTRLVDVGLSPRYVLGLGSWEMFDDEDGKEFVDAVKRAGYDSVIFNDTNPETGNPFEAWALLAPTQIKSATGNNGQFSPNNPDIRYSPVRTINVDGIERAATNSNGKPIAQDDEGVRNFWRWFGDSRVVDEQGRPMVVYHGTSSDFSVFDLEGVENQAEDTGLGFFFADRKKEAEYFTKAQEDLLGSRGEKTSLGANILPVYLAIRKPKTYATQGKMFAALSDSPYSREGPGVALYEQLSAKGFDGVVVNDSKMDGEGSGRWFIAFDPEQIKSAIGNNGQFSPDDPDIRYSPARKRAGLTPERIERLFSQFAYTQDDKRTKAYIAWVSPEDFLRATTPANERGWLESEKTKLDIAALRRESQGIQLQGELEDGHWVTRGHEGRHRMMALRDEGVVKTPVVMYAYRGEQRDPVRAAYVRPQKWGETRAEGGFFVRELIPINYENENRIAQEFGNDEVDIQFSPSRARLTTEEAAKLVAEDDELFDAITTYQAEGDAFEDAPDLAKRFIDILQRITPYPSYLEALYRGEPLQKPITRKTGRGFTSFSASKKTATEFAKDAAYPGNRQVVKTVGKIQALSLEDIYQARMRTHPGESYYGSMQSEYFVPDTQKRIEDVRFSPSRATLGDLTPAQEAAANHVLGAPKTLMQRLADFKKDWAKNLKQGIFDQFAPIAELDQNAYIQARLSKGGESSLEALMLYGKLFVGADGATDVRYTKAGGPQGFASKMAALKGEHDRFFLWVAAQRADRLKAIGLENLFSDTDIAELKTLNQGAMKDGTGRPLIYAQAMQDLNDFNDNVLQVAVTSGLIDDATRQMYRDTPYVPFYRLQEDDEVSGFGIKPGLVNQYAWKKLKGGTEQLNQDLLANMLHNWSHLITASAKNRAARATLDAAVVAGVAAQIPAGMPGKGHVSYKTGGQEQVFVVSDPHLMDAVAALHYAGLGPWAKPLSTAKHWLTVGVTANPAFKLRNLIRDSIGALGTADLSYNAAGNIAQGWRATAEDSETRAHLLASGGMIRFGSMLDGKDSQRAQDLIKQGVDPNMILDSDAKIKRFWKRFVSPALTAYNELGDRTEQVNRAALYEQLIAKGMTNAEAAYWSRDLMDFSMSGKWTAIRTLTQTVPFFNARLQGLYKLGRAGKQDIRRLGTVLGAITLASLALLLAYQDDDDWKKRSDSDRNNYWWFKVGGHAFRLPKPFEIGAVGTLAERSYEVAFNPEMTGDRFGKNMRDIVMSQLSMNPVPQLFKPMMDIYANRDSFTGQAIESTGMERLRKQDRYDERTSETAKFLGSLGLPDPTQLVMGRWDTLSPKQVDFLARGYFSWLATMTSTALDYGIRPMIENGARPAMQLKDVFFVGNFVESLPSNSSRYLTQMYDQAREIEQAYASYQARLKVGDVNGAKKILADEGDLIRWQKATAALKRQEGLLNARLQFINASTRLTAEEKRIQLDQVYARRNAIAERFRAL